jgi:hypothetical protein
MKKYKIIFMIIFIIILSCKPQSEPNETNNAENNFFIKNLEYNRNDIEDIEKKIIILVKEKRHINKYNENFLNNVTANIITDLNKLYIKKSDEKRLIKNYLILYQYIEVNNEEILNEACRNIFINKPKLVIDCLIGISEYLLEEFRNEEFLRELYKSVCDLPNKYYENGEDKKMKKKILKKLMLLRNNDNYKIIDFVIKENYLEN